MKIMGMTTRTEYKVTNSVFGKRKVRLCARGDQQEEGLQYNQHDIYLPVLKSAEVRLMVAIAAQLEARCTRRILRKRSSTATWRMTCTCELQTGGRSRSRSLPEGHYLQLKKNIYGTRQAARAWHLRISGWMESHGYPAINSEKTMFMKWDGDDFILHGLFVDDMSTVPTSDHLKEEFMALYSADFDVTGGDLMQSFLGLEVEQLDGCIKLHLDTYIQELIAEYQLIRPKFLKPKKVPMAPGLVLETNDCPETPDPLLQKQYRSMVAKIQFAAHWIRFDISYAAAQLARFCASAGP
jgi:hypothetical protein